MDASTIDRIRGALWGIFVADALSMPVHWYYNPADILRDFNRIKGYNAPKAKHPSSIMSLSNTGGHGRGGQQGRIIGDVINHGKHEFWGKPAVHYHQGMQAGENTLNALCARVVMRSITANGGLYSAASFLEDYVKFMTTPGSHNDTYAESFHRDFFKNWAAGVPPERCSQGTEGHNSAQIGGFVMLPPVIVSALPRGPAACVETAVTHLQLTHESAMLTDYARKYAKLLASVLQGRPLRDAISETGAWVDPSADDMTVVHRRFGPACYIQDSFPVVCYLAHKYADDFEGAVLANTNVGGENCHRGAALGALVGAAAGEKRLPRALIEGLHDEKAIRAEIDAFVESLGNVQGTCAP